ncbi:MAG: hypothetical protein RI996_219 [Candidatus Parcubacteria bacterium]|jgi:hypothetical protein
MAKSLKALMLVSFIGLIAGTGAAAFVLVPFAIMIGAGTSIIASFILRDQLRFQVPENTKVILVDKDGKRHEIGPGSHYKEVGDTVAVENTVSTAALPKFILSAEVDTKDTGNQIVLSAAFVGRIVDQLQFEDRGSSEEAISAFKEECQSLLDDFAIVSKQYGDSEAIVHNEGNVKKEFFGIELLTDTRITSVRFSPETQKRRQDYANAVNEKKTKKEAGEAERIRQNAITLGKNEDGKRLALAADPDSGQVEDKRNITELKISITGDHDTIKLVGTALQNPELARSVVQAATNLKGEKSG